MLHPPSCKRMKCQFGPSGGQWLWAVFPVLLSYVESDMLILPEQIIPICERLTSLAVESVVNKLLFLGKLYEVKCHNLGLISTNLQLKQVINNIHRTASNHTWPESRAFVLGFGLLLGLQDGMCVYQRKGSMFGGRKTMREKQHHALARLREEPPPVSRWAEGRWQTRWACMLLCIHALRKCLGADHS